MSKSKTTKGKSSSVKAVKATKTPVAKAVKTPAAKLTVGDKLSVIQPRLRRGDVSTISARTGYEMSHVRRVLKGERGNPSGEIVKTAYTMVSKRKVKA
jgi:hypothetical protein